MNAGAPPAGGPAPMADPRARTPEDDRLFQRIAEAVVRYRMTVPAILFLESVKPLSFVGSQALHFFEPMVGAIFTVPDYERFAGLMERRENLEALLVAIEQKDESVRLEERERRDRERAEKKARDNRKDPT
jgi:hypothetical protein